MDSLPHAGDVGRDAGSEPSLSDRYDLTGFVWCAGQHHPRVDASQNNACYLENKIGVTIWTSGLCRVEDESVQLNALLLRVGLIFLLDIVLRRYRPFRKAKSSSSGL